jgi:hypothetical protein
MKLTTCMFLGTALLVATAAACNKDDKAATSSKSGEKDKMSAKKEEPAAPKEEPAAKAGPVELAALGLVIDLAGGEVSEMMGDQLIQGSETLVTVGVEAEPKTLEAAVSDAEMYSPTFTKKEAIEGGYHLEFNNSGSMGANYFVEVVKKIGDKSYKCSTTASTPEQGAAASKACLSLRAK